jgi:hypothetical protein
MLSFSNQGRQEERDTDDDDLRSRAYAAYFRSGAVTIPAAAGSGVEEWQDKLYVVLRNVDGVLAVYRVRTSGALKRLRRWPKAVEG